MKLNTFDLTDQRFGSNCLPRKTGKKIHLLLTIVISPDLNFQVTHWPQGAAAFPTMWRVGRFQNAHLPRATHNYSPTKGWAKACRQRKRGQLGWQISGISFLPRVFGLYVETQNLKNPPQKAIVYIHIQYTLYIYAYVYTLYIYVYVYVYVQKFPASQLEAKYATTKTPITLSPGK